MLTTALRGLVRSLRRSRRPRRAPASLLVDWRAFGSGVHHVSQIDNLSEHGAFVRAVTPSPVGSPVVAEIGTLGGPLTVHARVAWVGPSGMGLRFTRPLECVSRS